MNEPQALYSLLQENSLGEIPSETIKTVSCFINNSISIFYEQ